MPNASPPWSPRARWPRPSIRRLAVSVRRGSMFRRLEGTGTTPITLRFEGRAIAARAGDTVAAALLAAGIESFRTTPRT
ncbi:MAG: 2Fe-2S iron-sulfur cluster-binding protein, partial [Pseudomonadota bacterium]